MEHTQFYRQYNRQKWTFLIRQQSVDSSFLGIFEKVVDKSSHVSLFICNFAFREKITNIEK